MSLEQSPAHHADQCWYHFEQLTPGKILDAAEDEEAAMEAAREVEDLVMDLDDALAAVHEVVER